MIIHY